MLLNCVGEKKPNPQLVTLSNAQIEIGILADAGAALVRASLVGKPNILNSDSTLWEETPEQRASLNPKAPFKTYNGMIVWLSPQSQWWTLQDDYPDLKASRSLWPPDPLLTLAPYRIISQTKNEITLQSPESRYSKVQLTKTFRIDGNKVHIRVQARNISRDTVRWGLWINTRMNGWDRVLVPAGSSDLVKSSYFGNQAVQKPALSYLNGCFSYEATEPEAGQAALKSKSFISVSHPVIAGFKAGQWLIIRGNQADRTRIHPEQASVEIYIENSRQHANDLQELEMHYAYTALAAGETTEAVQEWEILPGTGLKPGENLSEEIYQKMKIR